jgi:hypothetical protein
MWLLVELIASFLALVPKVFLMARTSATSPVPHLGRAHADVGSHQLQRVDPPLLALPPLPPLPRTHTGGKDLSDDLLDWH